MSCKLKVVVSLLRIIATLLSLRPFGKKKKDFTSDLCNHDGSMFHLPTFCTILLSALTIRPDKSDMILLNKIQAVWKCLFIFFYPPDGYFNL